MQGNNPKLKERAQELRRSRTATKQEKHLWYVFLKRNPVQFHRQVPMGWYIVDFYCPEVKLVIELDGSQHFEEDAMQYDEERTAFLEGMGCHVVRYTNHDVDYRFQSVCDDIKRHIRTLQQQQRKNRP